MTIGTLKTREVELIGRIKDLEEQLRDRQSRQQGTQARVVEAASKAEKTDAETAKVCVCVCV